MNTKNGADDYVQWLIDQADRNEKAAFDKAVASAWKNLIAFIFYSLVVCATVLTGLYITQ